MNKRVRLIFPNNLIQQPIIFLLARQYYGDELFSVSIIQAQVTEKDGFVKAHITGTKESTAGYLADLKKKGVHIQYAEIRPRR